MTQTEGSMKIASHRLAWLEETWQSISTELFDNDGLNKVFLHARNVITGAAVFAAGLYAVNHIASTRLAGMWTVHFAGYAIAALGAILLGLNLFDGLRRLARRKQHKVLRFATILVYVALSIRLTQVIIYFRSPI